ncbi:MAG: hypothetical protein PVSMB4_15010 [Ktedonobacterales bacterium]
MAKARDTFTDRLSNVIEVVELGRRTGMLCAERGAGPTFEEGEVYFVGGTAVYAAVAHLRGREALAVLGQWTGCRFAFEPDAARPAPNLAGASSPLGVPAAQRAHAQSRPMPPASHGTGGNGWSWSTPGGQAPDRQPAGGPPPGAPGRPPGSSPATNPWGTSRPGAGFATGPLGRQPRRSPDVSDLMAVVAAHNLSRSHRTMLLLADGTYNVLDLARLASKSVDEVTQMLAELEARGLIYYYE